MSRRGPVEAPCHPSRAVGPGDGSPLRRSSCGQAPADPSARGGGDDAAAARHPAAELVARHFGSLLMACSDSWSIRPNSAATSGPAA